MDFKQLVTLTEPNGSNFVLFDRSKDFMVFLEVLLDMAYFDHIVICEEQLVVVEGNELKIIIVIHFNKGVAAWEVEVHDLEVVPVFVRWFRFENEIVEADCPELHLFFELLVPYQHSLFVPNLQEVLGFTELLTQMLTYSNLNWCEFHLLVISTSHVFWIFLIQLINHIEIDRVPTLI